MLKNVPAIYLGISDADNNLFYIVITMKYIFFTIIFILILSGCTADELPAGIRGGGFKLADSDKQEQALEMLHERDVLYVIDSNGFVLYLLKDQAIVNGILREVKYGKHLNPNVWESTMLVNEEIFEIYVKAFKDKGITFDTYKKNGYANIKWNQLDGPKVDILRQQLDLEYKGKLIEQSKARLRDKIKDQGNGGQGVRVLEKAQQ